MDFYNKASAFRIILASASPRRQQLLRDMGLDFETLIRPCDESFPDHLHREQIALYLAVKKAMQYEDVLNSKTLLITADTIVVANQSIINKPENRDDAIRMLQLLSGRMHEVFTGVCIAAKERKEVFHSATEVYFRQLMNDEIEYYVDHYRPFDKAGAYGVQDWIGLTAIEKINGSFYNVMGLPVHEVYHHLKNFF